MRDKVLEILFECLPYDPDHFTCFVDATRLKIAAKLIEKKYKDEGYAKIKSTVIDCNYTECHDSKCRVCYDPYAEVDLGNKIQSTGDEVV